MLDDAPVAKLMGASAVLLILGMAMGVFVLPKGVDSVTQTTTQPVTLIHTELSVATITFPQATSIIVTGKNFTQTQPASTTTLTSISNNIIVSTSTLTETSTTTATQTTVIIYSQTATTSATVNGQISSTAALATGPIYPGKNATVNVTVNNGVGQILNMTFTPSVQTASQADHMAFYPPTFSRIVLTGVSTFNFSAKVTGYSSQAPSADYQVAIAESYVLNGAPGAISASVDIPVLNPLSISSYSISGSLTGSCSNRANPNSIGDYYCSITGNPNASGTISWQGQVVGGGQGCITWQVISPVVQVFVNNASIYNPCNSNGQPGFVIGPGAFGVSFSLGIPSSGAGQSNSVEFVWA